jgi:hypothetical protein
VRRGTDHGKGYRAEQFEDAFARYLPPLSIGGTVTNEGFYGSPADPLVTRSVARHRNVTDTSRENPSISADCHRVTDLEPPSIATDGVLPPSPEGDWEVDL